MYELHNAQLVPFEYWLSYQKKHSANFRSYSRGSSDLWKPKPQHTPLYHFNYRVHESTWHRLKLRLCEWAQECWSYTRARESRERDAEHEQAITRTTTTVGARSSFVPATHDVNASVAADADIAISAASLLRCRSQLALSMREPKAVASQFSKQTLHAALTQSKQSKQFSCAIKKQRKETTTTTIIETNQTVAY